MSRKAIYIAGGVIVVLLLVVVLLPFVVDANRFRPQIESAADGALNRKVTIGNIRLSILSGGVSAEDLSISDDPAFSQGPFLTAKSVTVAVELAPLIFSRALHVTGLTINEPEVSLLRTAAGEWNFSTLGAKAAAGKPARTTDSKDATATATAQADVSVQRLSIANGKITVGKVGDPGKRREYDNLNLDASDLSYTSQFPFQFTATAPGNGSLKLTGKAGPLNQTDEQQTPVEASLELKNLDLTSTGFIDPSSGIAGLLDFTASFNSDGQKVTSKGKVDASKMQMVPGGSPAKQPVEIDYETEYQLKSQTGEIKQGDVHIGKAVAHLTGTYNVSGETPTVQLKLGGENMPAADLESQLPALGIILPSGASLQSGSLKADLTASGPIDRLVATGPINLANGKLTGFDLGSKLGALSSFAGVPKGSDTVIQTLSSNVRSAPEGIRLDNLNLIVPVIGSLTGSGTIAPNHALDFKMVARLTNSASPLGGIAKLASAGSGQNGIPFKIQGTTSNPSFIPDMSGVASGLAKGLVNTPNQVPGVQNLGGALGGLFGKKQK
jgi:AsmA protein